MKVAGVESNQLETENYPSLTRVHLDLYMDWCTDY